MRSPQAKAFDSIEDLLADSTLDAVSVCAANHAHAQITIQALKAGKNELEVRVVNTWANRIIGDMQPDCQQKYTYTPDVFYRADSPLQPGGLLGPVEVWQVVEGK